MSTTTNIDTAKLKAAYKAADAKGKKLLADLHGAEIFQPNIKEQVKTFEDACKVLKLKPATVTNATDTKDEAAYKKLKVIAKALNQGWTPDWSNGNQYKYHPIFEVKATAKTPNGSGLVFYDGVAGWDSSTYVGSRLCFKNAELAEYAAKQFTSLYKDYLLF